MVLKRRITPTTVHLKEQLTVFGSLDAWTGQDDEELDPRKGYGKNGYQALECDEDEELPPVKRFFNHLKDTDSEYFNLLIGMVIVFNAAVIGFETEFGRGNFIFLEHFFNGVFFFEMTMRLNQTRLEYFCEPWNLFDFTLVCTGTLDLWILPIFTGASGSVHGVTSLRLLRLVRLLRLLRVLRIVRLFRMFGQLNVVLLAFVKAFEVVVVVSMFTILLNYVLAILLTQLAGQEAAMWGDDEALILEWFGTIEASMRTLFYVMTLSGWEHVCMTLVRVLPPIPVFFGFVTYIMITSYSMVSLITGIITESIAASHQDQKARRRNQIENDRIAIVTELTEFLTELLEDEMSTDGFVDAETLKNTLKGDQELFSKLTAIQICMNDKTMASLLDSMSQQGEVKVNVGYFVDKLCHQTGDAKALNVVECKNVAMEAKSAALGVRERMDRLEDHIQSMDSKLDRLLHVHKK